jgi:hypothetical protein
MPVKPNKNLDILNRRQQVSHMYLQKYGGSPGVRWSRHSIRATVAAAAVAD